MPRVSRRGRLSPGPANGARRRRRNPLLRADVRSFLRRRTQRGKWSVGRRCPQEIVGHAVLARDFAVSKNLNVVFHKPTPVDEPLIARAEVVTREGREVSATARLELAETGILSGFRRSAADPAACRSLLSSPRVAGGPAERQPAGRLVPSAHDSTKRACSGQLSIARAASDCKWSGISPPGGMRMAWPSCSSSLKSSGERRRTRYGPDTCEINANLHQTSNWLSG